MGSRRIFYEEVARKCKQYSSLQSPATWIPSVPMNLRSLEGVDTNCIDEVPDKFISSYGCRSCLYRILQGDPTADFWSPAVFMKRLCLAETNGGVQRPPSLRWLGD